MNSIGFKQVPVFYEREALFDARENTKMAVMSRKVVYYWLNRALLENRAVVRAVLTHLGRWQPKAVERAPPVSPEAWPAHASLPLTYQSVPDIA